MTSVQRTEHVSAELMAWAPEGVQAGKEVLLGLRIQHEPGWHTYWKNPGDSGLPTSLSWQHADGIAIGPIQWPTPKALAAGPLMNYGYEGDLLLPVTVEIPAGFSSETLAVKLHAKWLVCEEICIPESGHFALSIPTGPPVAENAALFLAANARLPEPASQVIATQANPDTLSFQVGNLPAEMQGHSLIFVSETIGVFDYAAPIEQQWKDGSWIATVPISGQRSASPTMIKAVLVDDARPAGVEIRLDASRAWSSATTRTPADQNSPPAQSGSIIWIALGVALIVLAAIVYKLNRSNS